jgi:hypothetical protein
MSSVATKHSDVSLRRDHRRWEGKEEGEREREQQGARGIHVHVGTGGGVTLTAHGTDEHR